MFSAQKIYIKTKISNEQTIQEMAKPIAEFTERHNVEFALWFDKDNKLIAFYEVKGKTTAYCKGVVAEIKQMFKDVFNCKIDVLVYAY